MDSFHMHLIKKIKNIETKLFYNNIKNLYSPDPIISFTFDDFPGSAYDVGGKILSRFKAKGTFYISMKFIDHSSPCGEAFNKNMLNKLIGDGHEIGCHTFDHLDAEINTPFEFENSFKKNQAALNDILGFVYPLKHFAYPYGHNSIGVKKLISKNFLTARGTTWGINKWLFDLNALKACKLYESATLHKEIEETIRKNANSRGWLIFYTHDVANIPTQFGCTAGLLEYTISLALKYNTKIKKINEVLKYISYGN